MHPTRRSLLSASAAMALVATGCAAPTAAELANDVRLIASGLASALSAVGNMTDIPAATQTMLQGYLSIIQTDAGQVAQATANAVGPVQEIAQAVQAIAAIVLPLIPGAAAVVPIINAAMSLLPAILAAVGVSGASVGVPVYTPDQARLILRAAAP